MPLACASSTGATQTRRSGGRFRHSTRMLERRGRQFARQKWPKSGAERADTLGHSRVACFSLATRWPRSLVPSNAHATRTAHARAMLAMLKAMCARDAREMLTRCSRDDAVGHARCADAARHGEGYALVARRARGVGGEVWLDGLPRLVRVRAGVPVRGMGFGFGSSVGLAGEAAGWMDDPPARLLLVHLLRRLWLALVASPRHAVTRLAPRLRGAGVGGSIGAGCVAPQWVVGWGL